MISSVCAQIREIHLTGSPHTMSQMRTFTPAISFQHTLSKDAYIFNLVLLGNSVEPSSTRGLNFAYIASDDSLNVLSVTTRSSTQSIKPINTIQKAHTGISCLVALRIDAGIVTAGRDGKAKLWSVRADGQMDSQAIMEVSTR